MSRLLQKIMSSGTLALGLLLAFTGGPELAPFGWFVAALGMVGVLAPIVLPAPGPRRSRRGP